MIFSCLIIPQFLLMNHYKSPSLKQSNNTCALSWCQYILQIFSCNESETSLPSVFHLKPCFLSLVLLYEAEVSHMKLLGQVEEAVEAQIYDAKARITAVHKACYLLNNIAILPNVISSLFYFVQPNICSLTSYRFTASSWQGITRCTFHLKLNTF